jgi:hypothetical protein
MCSAFPSFLSAWEGFTNALSLPSFHHIISSLTEPTPGHSELTLWKMLFGYELQIIGGWLEQWFPIFLEDVL